ncbi:MAG TPA: DNA alkylation repair protein [Bacteroidia bacterium]|nr:DNA alkylation repair protein [Bacteroidia bacterium]
MAKQLKNLLNVDFIAGLSKKLRETDPHFNTAGFQKAVFSIDWKAMELKARIRHVAIVMGKFLPYPYPAQIKILLKVAPEIGGLGGLVFPEFVEEFGLEDPITSLNALEILTCYSSGEFAIRPFVRKYPDETLGRIKIWTKHSNEHVRRLCSEGIRPRLPWSSPLQEFKKDPAPVLEILEHLKNDPSEYVRRSVANNLNDIAKDHPAFVLKTAQRWIGKSAASDKLLKHACRTLLKQGNSEALKIFGFKKGANASVKNLRAPKNKLRIGERLPFSFELHNESRSVKQLRVEYIVYFLKNNGSHAKKIFQLSSKKFNPGKTILKRSHSFKDFTTRKHYPGEHHLAIAVNGVEKIKMKFVVHRL